MPLTQEQSCEAASQPGVLGKHPIEYFSGQKVKSQLDYEDLGAFPLSVVRYYRSGVGAVGEPNSSYNSADYGIVPIGAGWRLGFGGKLLPSGDTPVGRNTPSLTARLWDGTQIGFDGTAVLDGNGNPTAISYSPRVAGQGSLSYQHSAIEADRRWSFNLAGSADKWVFNSLGQLLEHRNAQGQTHSYSYYSTGGRLRGITDAFGRSMQLAYNGSNGQLQSILPPLNQLPIIYSYDAQNRLSGVSYPNSGSNGSSTTITYHYEDSRFPNALTGITDEAGIRWQSYAYDAQGRAISSQLAGGAEHYQVAYTTTPATSTSPETITAAAITDALGTVRSYQYGMAAGRLAVLSASSASEDPNKDSAASRSQGAAGTIDSQTDFLGVQTQYQYDGLPAGSAAGAYSRRLLTQSTRAAGQPEEQSTRTQWHPSYNLPLEIIEAGRTAGSGAALADLRKTSYSYNSAGQVQSLSIQDLQNPSAPAQTISLTWYGDNPADPAALKGLLKTTSTAAAGTTTLAYDNLGHIASSTNALGQITSYSHDAAGRITAITAPDGTKTTYSYNGRGWLTARSHYAAGAGSATATDTFTYSPNGLLQSATLADGSTTIPTSTTTYQYDDARRLIGSSASDGRSVQYQYDNASNRTAEAWYQNGTLTWERTYAYSSANNRLQASFTGYGAINQFYSYDANANPSAQRLYRGEEVQDINSLEALPALISYGRDALGRITSTTVADGPDGNTNAATVTAIAHLQWDALSHLASATDAKGIATQYQNDALGRNWQEQSLDTSQSTTYYANGLTNTQTDARGIKTQYSWDALGRPTNIAWGAQGTASLVGTAGGTDSGVVGDMAPLGNTQIQWDGGNPSANTPAIGKISHITQAWGSRSYGYNTAGLLASDSVSLNSGQNTSTQYSYTAAGKISQITSSFANQAVPAADTTPTTTTSYSWSQGRVTAITRNGKTLISGVQYDAFGRPTTWRWADGQIARRRYDDGTGVMLANNTAAYGYDWYAGRITGITQNLYMPKTDAAEDELGFALQSNFYNIGYDQRGRINTFSRSAQATVGLPAVHETQAYAWDKNGNPSQITGTVKGMAIGVSSGPNTAQARIADTSTATTTAATTAAATTAATTATTSSMNWQPLPAAQRSARAGRRVLGFKTLPIPPSRLNAVAARPPLPRNHAAGAFDLQGKALIHSDKDSDYIYSAAQPGTGQYNAAGIDTSAVTAAISHAPVYAQPAQSWGKAKDKSQDKNAPVNTTAARAANSPASNAYAANSTTTNNLTDPPPEPVQAGFSVNYNLSLNPSSSNRATGAQLNTSFVEPGATAPEPGWSADRSINWPHDAAGNQLRDFNDNFQLGFDAAGRLARTNYWGNSSFQFYDLNGQRIFKTDSQSDTNFDSQNPAGSLNPNTAGVYYQYDQNGNLLFQQPVGGVSTGLLEHEAATHYYWLPTLQGDILVGFDQGINSYAVYTDHLGTPRLVTKIDNPQNPKPITDTSNDLPLADYGQPEGISPLAIPVWQWSYSPFGADLANGYEAQPTSIKDNFKPSLWPWMGLPETGGADQNQVALETWRIQANLSIPPVLNIRYPGQYYDFEAGLVQNWWRTYEPRIGRYTSADPIGLGGGWNRFGYVAGDGINNIDPYGLWVWGDPIHQGIVDAAAGFGDDMSFGATNWVRDQMGSNDSVNKCSGAYTGGQWAGVGFGLAMGGVGAGLRVGKTAPMLEKDFFAGTKYTDKVLGQMKMGDFHAFPESVKGFQNAGQLSKITGGDGLVRDMLKIPGGYKGKQGVFEFIKESNGSINHRLFRPYSGQ